MLGLGIISIPFCLISLYFIGTHLQFRLYGKKVLGKVHAYEKYISTTRTSGSGASSQLMYAPLYKFNFMGQDYFFFGAGSNYFPYEIGDELDLYILGNNPKNVRPNNKVYPLFGFLFGCFGFGAQYFYHSSAKISGIEHLYPLVIALLVPYAIYYRLKQKGLIKEIVKSHFENSSMVTLEEIKDRDIFFENLDIEKEEAKTHKLGLIVTLVFACFMAFGGLHAWHRLNYNIKKIILSFEKLERLLQHKEDPMLILLAFCSVMGIMLIYSMIFSLRKIQKG
jgi:hypothetical protein